MPYSFAYKVNDPYNYNDFGHKEKNDGYATTGEYFVNLPDGRLQVVKYISDHNGYRADVSYIGEAKYERQTYSQSYDYKSGVNQSPETKYNQYNSIDKPLYRPSYNQYKTAYKKTYAPSYDKYKSAYKPTYAPKYKYKPIYKENKAIKQRPTYPVGFKSKVRLVSVVKDNPSGYDPNQKNDRRYISARASELNGYETIPIYKPKNRLGDLPWSETGWVPMYIPSY